ncbi:hypothetical protein GF342_03880 [Candidatus Woesearchaeota archaeon]|nr:hypothetical protein [Candidatus Woesearchaeota archaeon]
MVYLALSVISSVGLLLGFLVGKWAKEELVHARVFLQFSQEIFVLLIAWVFLSGFLSTIVTSGIIGVLVLLVALLHFKNVSSPLCWLCHEGSPSQYVLYGLLGAALLAGYRVGQLQMVASLAFLLGFPTGSLLFQRTGIRSVFLSMTLLVLIAFVSWFVF